MSCTKAKLEWSCTPIDSGYAYVVSCFSGRSTVASVNTLHRPSGMTNRAAVEAFIVSCSMQYRTAERTSSQRKRKATWTA
jgi:hypothetical protein